MSQNKKSIMKTKQFDFTEGEIIKPIILFSLPILVGNIFSALYNIVDSVVVGQFVGSYALAAVNSSFAITTVCTAVYAGFGMGSAILLGQLFGAKRFESLNKAAATAFIGALTVGIAMSIFGLVISRPLLQLINTPPDILEQANIYLKICMCGCTTQLFYFMGSGMLRGLGDSKSPMYYLIMCALINIVLDLLLVIRFNMGCAGVALATVIAQMVSGILVVRRILTGGYGIRLTKSNFKLDWEILRMILKIGIPSAIQQLVNSVGLLFIQSFSNSFGTNLVAANGIIQKIDVFALLPMQAMGQTISMFNAQNLGAGKKERAQKGNRRMMFLVFGIGLVIGIFLFFMASPIFRLFINPADSGYENIIRMGNESVKILAFFYCIYAVQHGFAAILQGAGATKPVMLIAIFSIIIRVPLTYCLAMMKGSYQNLYWSTDIFNTIFMLGLLAYYRFGKWERYIQVKRNEKPNMKRVFEQQETA